MEQISLLNEALQALAIISDPIRIAHLLLGVLFGLVLGVIPGLGGLVGLSLLLPFTFGMDPYTALAFLIGLQSVTVTSDTIPAVLFGVPGTVGSAATILDGYPMARQGQAGRAFGAAFTASVIGGLWGALLLGISIPILRPALLYIGSPELLTFCLFGLSLAAVLSGGSALKGLAAACIGVMVATAGEDSQSGTLRWSESLYLWSGFPVVPVALGLFAIPEIADLAIQRKSIAQDGKTGTDIRSGQLQGARDVFRSWFLVLRCSTIGAGLGAIPGLGASVIDWIAYGHAARSEKGAKESFGSGDVRGVIASESSNNAKEGGALVPTIAFGVPGSASMALILGAFLIHGLVPGPEMLTQRLDITYTMVWSVAFANIFGAGICFIFARQLAKVGLVRIGLLAPVVLALVFIGAFQGSQHWGDIYALLAFGALGFVMKRLHWPRPPLILGFVLGALVERYMFISVHRYGADWLWQRPVVALMLVVTAFGILSPLLRRCWRARRDRRLRAKRSYVFRADKLDADIGFVMLVLGLFVVSLYVSAGWDDDAKLVPQIAAGTAVCLLGLYLAITLFTGPPSGDAGTEARRDPASRNSDKAKAHFDLAVDFADLEPRVVLQRAAVYFGWLVALVVLAMVVGLLPAIFFFLLGYMRVSGRESWASSLTVSIALWLSCYALFHNILIVAWPQSLLGDWFPQLRAIPALNLF